MILKVYFEKTNNIIPFANQKQLNGFNHSILGKDNKYHDTFSNYSISSIQGGRMADNKSGIVFPNEPYIIVSSIDYEFMSAYITGVYQAIANKNADFFGLKPTRIAMTDFNTKEYFDVITTNSPILLKNKEQRKINCKDNGWLEELNNHCKRKLERLGIVDDSFSIQATRMDTMHSKMVMVGDVFNPCTNATLTVYGKKETRHKLYSIGLGCSTGSGFGSVSIREPKHTMIQ